MPHSTRLWSARQQPTPVETRNEAVRRAAAELGEPLSVADYDDWRRDHEDAPSGPYISFRWGWNDACLDAGVTLVQ